MHIFMFMQGNAGFWRKADIAMRRLRQLMIRSGHNRI
jgi:hypothetical protein